MKKRVLALLLSVLMTLSLLPVSAFAADLGEEWEELGTTEAGANSFTDENADPNTEYEYTVVGSDGSVQTVDVPAADDTGDTGTDYETQYGKVTETTGTGETYYELMTNGAAGIKSGEKYLIVNTDSGDGYALTKTATGTAVTVANNRIESVDPAAVFELNVNEDGYSLKDNDGKYLYITYALYSQKDTADSPVYIQGSSPVTVGGKYSSYMYYLYTYSGTTYNVYYNYPSNFYLFKEVSEPSGTAYKVEWNDAAEALLNECNDLNPDNYTADSWAPFQEALTAVKEARAAGTFDTQADANAALDTMTTLAEAKANLVAGEVFYPDIEWKRTLELDHNQTGTGDLLTEQLFTAEGTNKTYPTVFWDWNIVSGLTTDPDMTVWDYGTNNQYSSKSSNSNIKAATWVHRGSDGGTPSWSCKASVRKIAGTFEWPANYDLDDTAALVSVNDSYYKPIYDYIADSNNDDYKKATEGKYILPANDDIYVFMYAEGDEPTAENYMDYLVFWTGTSGKGVWSSSDNNRRDDWAKTTPSTFNDIYANRSFHGVTPNLWASADETTSIQNLSDAITGWDTTLMNQSDGWYTFADTAGIAKVLKNNYTNTDITAGTKMHIDIYCFDNDGDGGMDQLQLKMVKTPETHASVEVRYYLDEVDGTVDETGGHYLGSTYLEAEIDSQVTLLPGTDTNQLNHMKAKAITKANNTDVYDGQQMNYPTITAAGPNVINVLYIQKTDKKVITLTADTQEFDYDGNYHSLNLVTIVEPGYTGSVTTTNGTVTLPDGNKLVNAFSYVSQKLPGKYDNNFKVSDGSATSNIIQVQDTSGNNITSSYIIKYIPGTLTIKPNVTAATYTYDFGVSNQYDKVLSGAYNVELLADAVTVPEKYAEIVSVTRDTDDNATITYTPKTVNTGEIVPLTLTFAGGYSVTKNITFLPESNVMYEENMVTADGSSWTECGTPDTKKVTEHNDVYGYTEAYDSDTMFSGGSALYATLTEKQVTGTATFTFTGTGFDLISECGTNTGMLVVGVKDASGKAVKAYVVDTYFCGDEKYVKGNGILDYQVPVVRKLDLPYGSYTVTVAGYLASSAGALTKNAVATQSLSNATPSADDILRAAGMSEYLDADVEVSFMDDNSVLNGGTGPAVTTPSFFSRVRSFFRGLASTQAAPDDNAICAYIDAFRVYQPLNDDDTAYVPTEQGTKYYSLYDFVKSSVNDLGDYADNTAVYIEYDGDTNIASIADYKDQGPQNEVYLTPGNAIAFALEGYREGDTVQVSAKAVTDEAVMDIDPLPATEMYYDVEVVTGDPTVEWPYVIIQNDGTGILSVSGLKVSENITFIESAELGEKIIGKLNDKTGNYPFVPANLTVTTTSSAKVNRSFAIKIEASAKDVARVEITVDGVTSELTASNTKAVAQGKATNYKYSKLVKESTAGTYTYTVIAYDGAGNASAPVTVTVEVK